MDNNSTPNEGNEAAQEERQPILTGTSAQLFPDLNDAYMEGAYGKSVNPPTPEEVTGAVGAKEDEAAKPDTEKTPEVEDFLDTEQIGNKKVRVKVDGVEMDVTFKDLMRGYQTEQHLTKKGQKLGEKERSLKEIEQSLVTRVSTPQTIIPSGEPDPIAEVVNPYVTPLKQEIADLKKTVTELKGATQPLEYQQNLKRVDNYLKGKGYEDFMQYVPEIEQIILGLPVEEQVEYDNPLSFMNLYKDFKIRDLKKQPKDAKPLPDERPKPKVSEIKVESSTGSIVTTDEKAVKDKSLFDKAVESGKTEDWIRVLNHRGV